MGVKVGGTQQFHPRTLSISISQLVPPPTKEARKGNSQALTATAAAHVSVMLLHCYPGLDWIGRLDPGFSFHGSVPLEPRAWNMEVKS